MSRIGAEIAIAALSAIEAGLAAGQTPDAGALTGLIAGLSSMADREPADNERQAVANLTGMLFPEAVEAPAPAAPIPDLYDLSPDGPLPSGGDGQGSAAPSDSEAAASDPVQGEEAAAGPAGKKS